ncbi:ABC transporter permease [Bosea vestrisii]|uniref:ABC transporter permease n=1 Tax=Bosea vestrisii TaxID=151416 RepID=UPI0024DF5CED|nr:ABC transporter permease [Bosea vestrisii]WID95225.1 ABC transporter permease [Bosea vestrisii]
MASVYLAGSTVPNKRSAFSLVLPALLISLFLYLLPLLLLGRYSLNRFVPGQFMLPDFTFANYANIVLDPYYRNILFVTVSMSLGITFIALMVGIPLAHLISRSTRYKKLLILLVVIPLFVGSAVRAAGWMLAFGEQGLINALLTNLHIVERPVQIMYTPLAVLIGAAAVNIPFVVLTIQSVLDGLNPSLEEASLSLGATPFETFREVTLPLAMPGIKAAFVISFILGMNAYATPVLLGGPSFQMMAPAVASEILAKNNWPVGAALAFFLVVSTLILTTLSGRSKRS